MVVDFQILKCKLPSPGVIPGAWGYRKTVVPIGTDVWCITFGSRYYWCCYLSEASAQRCMAGLKTTCDVHSKGRKIALDNLLAWNFSKKFPTRVAREKTSEKSNLQPKA